MVGLYFGSFNPIHHGHLIIATYILHHSDLDRIWFVVSPQNPLKPAKGLLNEYQRLYLVKIAIEGEKNLRASDIEFGLPRPSYTASTLAHLAEKYPHEQFAVVMGSDSLQNISRWKNHRFILENYPIYVYGRHGHETIPQLPGATIIQIKAPLLEISATHIRESLQKGLSIRYLVPENVREEIDKGHYYRQ